DIHSREQLFSLSSQKKYLDWLGQTMGIRTMEDWYGILWEDLVQKDRHGILRYYHGSPYKALSEIYPDHPWLPWKFQKLSTGYFNKIENRYRYMEWLSQELSMDHPDRWYSINAITLEKKYWG